MNSHCQDWINTFYLLGLLASHSGKEFLFRMRKALNSILSIENKTNFRYTYKLTFPFAVLVLTTVKLPDAPNTEKAGRWISVFEAILFYIASASAAKGS